MAWFKRLVPYLIIVAFVLYVCMPLLQPGFYSMHDDEQIARLYDLDLALKAGHFPPRIIPNLGFGYGYPFFNFYPPFAYYVGEIFYILGFSLITSTKLMLGTGFLLSAVFMYLFAKQLFGKLGGMLSAISYTLLSYKAVDVYARGAFAEFFAFVPIPLIFLSIYKIGKGKNSWFIIWNILAVAVLILSHNLIALMSTPFIGIWILYNLYLAKQKIRYVTEISVSFILGFGLTAYFFIPSYFERGYTLVNILTKELANYTLHFVCAYQLWDSPWGYGGSIPSCYDGLSFEVGKVQLIASIIVFVFSLYKIIRLKKERVIYISSVLLFFMLAISLFLMVRRSIFVWDILQPFWYIQFPWRFLLFAGFFASVLTGGIVLLSKNKYIRYGLWIVIVMLLLYFSQGKFVPQRSFQATDEDYTNFYKIRYETSGLAYEYVPNGIKTITSEIGTTKIDITPGEVASSAATVITGEMKAITNVEKPQIKELAVNVEMPGIFQINTFSFPGWKTYIDGNEVDYNDNNKFKLIQLELPKGEHRIIAKFTETPVRIYGNIVTVVSIIGTLILVLYLCSTHYVKKR